MKKIKVSCLTGFLGAGKTTLLNHILNNNQDKKFAVIVNEFGEIDIDGKLIIGADEEILEVNNGCICCTVRGDLIRILEKLVVRKDIDYILIETTGLAEISPILQTFFLEEDLRKKLQYDGTICLVDSYHFYENLEEHECVNQLTFSDVILLNKIDLVSSNQLENIKKEIRNINKYAKIYETSKSTIDVNSILDIGAFDLNKILEIEPEFFNDDPHEHEDDITSVSFEVESPIILELLRNWLSEYVLSNGPNLLRYKGIFNIHESPIDKAFVIQGVHMLYEGSFTQLEKPKTNKFVIIGKNLNKEEIFESIKHCFV